MPVANFKTIVNNLLHQKASALFQNVVDGFSETGGVGSSLVGAALLHDALGEAGIDSEVILGFALHNEPRLYHRHAWILCHDRTYDPGSALMSKALRVEVNPVLVITPPEERYVRMDNNTIVERQQLENLERGYHLYTSDPDAFWEGSPDSIRLMRVNLRAGVMTDKCA
jgi:hypothetical protein